MSQQECIDALVHFKAFSKQTAVPSRFVEEFTQNRNAGDNLMRLRKAKVKEIEYYSEYKNTRFYYWLIGGKP